MTAAESRELYDRFLQKLRDTYSPDKIVRFASVGAHAKRAQFDGKFQAMMNVSLRSSGSRPTQRPQRFRWSTKAQSRSSTIRRRGAMRQPPPRSRRRLRKAKRVARQSSSSARSPTRSDSNERTAWLIGPWITRSVLRSRPLCDVVRWSTLRSSGTKARQGRRRTSSQLGKCFNTCTQPATHFRSGEQSPVFAASFEFA
jgi:hypothetical protein